jgi:hypothetical protein
MSKRLPAAAAGPVPPATLTTIADLVPDPLNRRTHPERNVAMIAASLRDVGTGRSLVIDEDNVVQAGNGVLEAAARVGLSKVQIVDVEGDTLVAVRRRGLTPEQKRSLALFDNRTSELAEWNADVLRDDQAAGLDLAPFFSDQELAKVLKTIDAPDAFAAVDETIETQHACPKCGYEWSGKG